MHKLFHTTKSDIIEMSWDEIYELMGRLIKHNFYNEFVEYLGSPPHVIKHDESLKLLQDRKPSRIYLNEIYGDNENGKKNESEVR